MCGKGKGESDRGDGVAAIQTWCFEQREEREDRSERRRRDRKTGL
jgi:hypothetical protein